MDSNYISFESYEKEKNKEKKNSKYQQFIGRLQKYLKSYINDEDEIKQLPNHFKCIAEYEKEFEDQRQNCVNCYNALKEQISTIEEMIPDVDINIFNTFFQTFEEYYTFFKKSKEILEIFSKFNEQVQDFYYFYKKNSSFYEGSKEFLENIYSEYIEIIKNYENLNKKYKNINESYNKLYQTFQEKQLDDNIYGNENKDLIIKNLNKKIDELKVENDRIKKLSMELSDDLQIFQNKCIYKNEHEKIVKELYYKLNSFEKSNNSYKKDIENLKTENEKLIKENEYLEAQINSNLNNFNNNHLESLNEDHEEKDKKNDDDDDQDNLENLLKDCEENETEELNSDDNSIIIKKSSNENSAQKEKKENIININKEENNKENKEENKEEKNVETKKDNLKKTVFFNANNNFSKKNSALIKSKKLNLKYNTLKASQFRNNKDGGGINSAYNLMFKGKQFQFPTRVANKQNVDYFKQFFFLLFQSMKMNNNKIDDFLKYEPESLYNKCRSQHVPFHKFQTWIENEILNGTKKENEDFEIMTGIICSSLI